VSPSLTLSLVARTVLLATPVVVSLNVWILMNVKPTMVVVILAPTAPTPSALVSVATALPLLMSVTAPLVAKTSMNAPSTMVVVPRSAIAITSLVPSLVVLVSLVGSPLAVTVWITMNVLLTMVVVTTFPHVSTPWGQDIVPLVLKVTTLYTMSTPSPVLMSMNVQITMVGVTTVPHAPTLLARVRVVLAVRVLLVMVLLVAEMSTNVLPTMVGVMLVWIVTTRTVALSALVVLMAKLNILMISPTNV